jgi:hypothetical protein
MNSLSVFALRGSLCVFDPFSPLAGRNLTPASENSGLEG